MDAPKYIVCMQGVEGFVADYGDLQLATDRAKELCTAKAETYVLVPVKRFRRTAQAGRLVEEVPEVEPSEGERLIAAELVVKHRQAGRTRGPTTEELERGG